jgi:hypothetical protein
MDNRRRQRVEVGGCARKARQADDRNASGGPIFAHMQTQPVGSRNENTSTLAAYAASCHAGHGYHSSELLAYGEKVSGSTNFLIYLQIVINRKK